MPRESTIQIYRSTTASSVPSLTAGEMAINIPDKRLYVGGTAANIAFLDSGSVVTGVNGATGAITVTGAGAVLFTQSGTTNTINARLASASATGVASFGNQFVVSAAGAVSLTSNYVASVNGSTGAITNVARTNVANTFTALQSFSSGISASGATFGSTVSIGNSGIYSTINLDGLVNTFQGNGTIVIQNPASTPLYVIDTTDYHAIEIKPAQHEILFYNSNDGDSISLKADIEVGSLINPTVTIPNYTTTIAGLAGTQTFTGTNTFNALTNFGAGISSAGGVTFGGTVASNTGYRITSNAINPQTGTSYTLTGTDNGKIVTFNNAATTTVTIPTGLDTGFNCTVIQLGAGQVGFTAASGLTMQSYGNQFKLLGQHASATVLEYTTNIVNISGNLTV